MPSVCVFTPAPMLTVTVEAATVEAADAGNELHLHAGGQGVWIARLVAELGVDVTMCSTFGGETGQVVRCLLAGEGIEVNETLVSSANGGYVHDRRSGSREEVAAMDPGPFSRHELDELYGATLTAALAAGVCVLGGPGLIDVVPGELYRRLASDLVANGCLVVADLSGDPLDGVIEGGASVIKVSHEELLRDGRAASDDQQAMLAAISEISGQTQGAVVCSRAGEPALAVQGDRSWEVTSPQLEPVESRGAGDSFTAGLVVGMSRGMPFDAALGLAAAAGTLNVTRHGLGTGRRDQVESLVAHVGVREFDRR